MGRKAQFNKDHFVDAALKLLAERGPAAVTMAAVAGEIGAPIGSVYHRFVSRDVLLAELWLRIVESFQRGFLEALKRDDGLNAALHTLHWVRQHPKEGRVLLLHRREDLASGEWPDDVKERAERLSREINEEIQAFTRRLYGRITRQTILRVTFVLIDVPYASVRRHLEAGNVPPKAIDDFVKDTYFTILGRGL
jgi:AcrR family transcriptional regulator